MHAAFLDFHTHTHRGAMIWILEAERRKTANQKTNTGTRAGVLLLCAIVGYFGC
jgi:hypothetical protein